MTATGRKGSSSSASQILTAVALAATLAGLGAYHGISDIDSLIEFIIGPYRASISLQPVQPAARNASTMRFAAGCVFAAIAVVAAAWICPTGTRTWLAASLALRTLFFLMIAALSLVATAAYHRFQFSQFLAGTYDRPERMRPHVWVTDLPLARVPVISGLTALVLALVLRMIARRRARKVGG
jgi:hypothetical protein